MQFVIDALRLTSTLRVCVLNVEMPAPILLDRQLARLSGVDLTTIRYRRLDSTHAERIDLALTALDEISDRLCFVKSPFDLANVAATADAFGAGLLVLDYLQRIKPPGDHADKRGSVDAMMNYLRQFADAGAAVCASSRMRRLFLARSPRCWRSGSRYSGRRSVGYEMMKRACVVHGLTPKPRSCRRRAMKARL